MALNNFSTDQVVVVVNGREIKDWGETDPPISEAPIDQKSNLRRGLGGNATRLDRINPGRQVTLNLNPGSADSAFLQGLFLANETIVYGRTVIGSLEVAAGAEGVMVNDGNRGRGGVTLTDDQFIIQFNNWTEMIGGAA